MQYLLQLTQFLPTKDRLLSLGQNIKPIKLYHHLLPNGQVNAASCTLASFYPCSFKSPPLNKFTVFATKIRKNCGNYKSKIASPHGNFVWSNTNAPVK